MSDEQPQPPPRKKRFEDHSITYKHVVYALPFVAAALAALGTAFGSFVIGQASAQGMAAVKMAEQSAAEVKQLSVKIDNRDAGLRGEIFSMRKDFTDQQQVVRDEMRELRSVNLQILKEIRKVNQ